MLVICNGMPRSASTWSFNVVLGLLRRLEPGSAVHSGYDENVAHFVQSQPPSAPHALLKCHQLDARGRALAQAGDAKVIYTWRDPADAIASCMRTFAQDFETALGTIDASIELYCLHRQQGSALIVHYEEIETHAASAVGRIAGHLDLDPGPDTISAVAEETSSRRMREKSESLPTEAFLLALSGVGIAHDPETLLHRNHIRDGSSGYGRRQLTAVQLERVDSRLRERGLT